MTTAFDHALSTGSLLRCVCPKCNTPRVPFSSVRSCYSCKSELVIWYRKVGSFNSANISFRANLVLKLHVNLHTDETS